MQADDAAVMIAAADSDVSETETTTFGLSMTSAVVSNQSQSQDFEINDDSVWISRMNEAFVSICLALMLLN